MGWRNWEGSTAGAEDGQTGEVRACGVFKALWSIEILV